MALRITSPVAELEQATLNADRSAIRAAAASEITSPIQASDVEVEIAYTTNAKPAQRLDADNMAKTTLDALKEVAYLDDHQVRSVTATLFDRGAGAQADGGLAQLERLLDTSLPHVVLVLIYSDTRLAELGGTAQ